MQITQKKHDDRLEDSAKRFDIFMWWCRNYAKYRHVNVSAIKYPEQSDIFAKMQRGQSVILFKSKKGIDLK